ncbi:MAG: bis(5'-nucleosyl)-tetraphosphatase (symmetrical) YqeK [Syntrophomonas sp.]|nr:bis(5'-nucleosyl)-tetraphosphatase (symmetrical) YqeK [Syntrophomonas sp.]
MIANYDQAEALIRKRLSPGRCQHSVGVAQTAARLAGLFGLDTHKAYITGILHDYAKNLSPEQLLEVGTAAGLITHPVEIECPELLHAPVGAYLLETELGMDDAELLSATRVHTLGSTYMSKLDKIIYLADMIEPTRSPYPELERLRQLAGQALDQAMLFGLEATIHNCLERGRMLHPVTVEARNQFLRQLQGKAAL